MDAIVFEYAAAQTFVTRFLWHFLRGGCYQYSILNYYDWALNKNINIDYSFLDVLNFNNPKKYIFCKMIYSVIQKIGYKLRRFHI